MWAKVVTAVVARHASECLWSVWLVTAVCAGRLGASVGDTSGCGALGRSGRGPFVSPSHAGRAGQAGARGLCPLLAKGLLPGGGAAQPQNHWLRPSMPPSDPPWGGKASTPSVKCFPPPEGHSLTWTLRGQRGLTATLTCGPVPGAPRLPCCSPSGCVSSRPSPCLSPGPACPVGPPASLCPFPNTQHVTKGTFRKLSRPEVPPPAFSGSLLTSLIHLSLIHSLHT